MSGQTIEFPVAKDAIPALLQAHAVLPTAQRVEIAGILLAASQHLSADQVLARLATSGAAVSKATVYNTLGLFAERGLVRRMWAPSGHFRPSGSSR